MMSTGHTTRRQPGQSRQTRRATTARYRKPAIGATSSQESQVSQIATTAPAPDLQRRREGWRVLRQLRAAVAALNATIVAAARHDARVSLRVAPITDAEADEAEEALLASLPAQLPAQLYDAFASSGVLTGLACADVYGDPLDGAIILDADALDALRWADIRLDDALLSARLTRPGSREGWSEEAQAKALATLATAIAEARDATQRAQRLTYDVATVARLLSIVCGALATQRCPA